MSKRCATCWKNPVTKAWRVTGNVKIGGTSDSNWICRDCKRRPANRGWIDTPDEEVTGIEVEHDGDTKPLPDSEPASCETKLCVEIMRRYCLGQSQRGIAEAVGKQRLYVRKTICYWETHRPYFLKQLKKAIELLCEPWATRQ